MKKYFVIMLSVVFFVNAAAQDRNIYNPSADAAKDIKKAVAKAKKENKFVLIQAGGNWCGWCIAFERFCKADAEIDSLMNASFVRYHLNYSKENENKKIFAGYGFPQRFGFPVFIILNAKGERIHTQNSEYLENGMTSYDRKKLIDFIKMWSPPALDPAKYDE